MQIYDLKKSLTWQTGASLKGFGAVLFQVGHPVNFATKSPAISKSICHY